MMKSVINYEIYAYRIVYNVHFEQLFTSEKYMLKTIGNKPRLCFSNMLCKMTNFLNPSQLCITSISKIVLKYKKT